MPHVESFKYSPICLGEMSAEGETVGYISVNHFSRLSNHHGPNGMFVHEGS